MSATTPEKQPLIVDTYTGELLGTRSKSWSRRWLTSTNRRSDDQGYAALGAFPSYYVEHCGSLVHAQDDGFYEGDRIILELA